MLVQANKRKNLTLITANKNGLDGIDSGHAMLYHMCLGNTNRQYGDLQ